MRLQVVCAVSWFVIPASAWAQTDPAAEAARQGYARRMQECGDAGDWSCVIEQGTLAGQIRPSTSLTMWLALGHQHLGHVLEALDAATRCQVQARADASNPDRARILAQCDAIVGDVERRVARIVVRAPTPVPEGFEVSVRGARLAPALWGIGYPVLPGSALVEARSGAGGTFTSRIDIPAGEQREVRVVLAVPPTGGMALRPSDEQSRSGIGPWVVVGAGGAALFTSAVLLGLHVAALGARDGVCSPGGCTDAEYARGTGHNADAERYGTAAIVMLGAGVGAVAGGLVWYFLGRPTGAARRAVWQWSVTPGQGGASVNVEGVL